jgi:methylisocitrate lyase
LYPVEKATERIRAAVAARRNPDFLIVARSDAFWVHRDLEDCIARLEAYAEAGADRPIMVVDNPGERHDGAAIVLYYAFSITRQFAALERALAEGNLASDTRALEDFLGYKDGPGRGK